MRKVAKTKELLGWAMAKDRLGDETGTMHVIVQKDIKRTGAACGAALYATGFLEGLTAKPPRGNACGNCQKVINAQETAS